MTADDEADLLDLAAAIACRAAAAVMAVRAVGGVAVEKADASPVTAADRIAEAIIVEGLRAARPDIPLITEEGWAAEQTNATVGTAPALPGKAGGGRCWLVDPLAGTREFAAGLEEFAINCGTSVGDLVSGSRIEVLPPMRISRRFAAQVSMAEDRGLVAPGPTCR